MKPFLSLSLALLLGAGGVAQAQPMLGPGPFSAPYATLSRVHPGTEATTTLHEGMDKLFAFLDKKEKPNKLQVAAFLDANIAPYFDFHYMAKWVAGRRWIDMNQEQRDALAASLEARFLSTLANQLARYRGQQARFFRPRPGPRGAVNVTVVVPEPGGHPSRLEFRMYHAADGWKVYDVVANGRSAVAFYRQEYRRSYQPRRPMPYGG